MQCAARKCISAFVRGIKYVAADIAFSCAVPYTQVANVRKLVRKLKKDESFLASVRLAEQMSEEGASEAGSPAAAQNTGGDSGGAGGGSASASSGARSSPALASKPTKVKAET